MAGRMINGTAALAELIRPASDTDEAGVHRILPVPPELSGLLPGRGLRRGSTVAVAVGRPVAGSGNTSLLTTSGTGFSLPTLESIDFTTDDSAHGSSLPASGRGGKPLSAFGRASSVPGGGEASVSTIGSGRTSLPAPGRDGSSPPAGGSGASAWADGWSSPAASGMGRTPLSSGMGRTSLSTIESPGTSPSVSGSGGTSLLLSLLSAASQSGSWCAVVGVPALGALAAAESGIALDRLALVPNPGPDWPTVVAALIDGVDVVVAAIPGPVSASIASRLAARARQRGSVLVPLGSWTGADVTLQVMHGAWDGLGAGHGRLRRRQVVVTARGRGAAARPREVTLWMPGMSALPPIDPPPTAADPDQDRVGDAAATLADCGVAATGIRTAGGRPVSTTPSPAAAAARDADGESDSNIVAGAFGWEGTKGAGASGGPEPGHDVVDIAPRRPGRDGRRRTRLTAVS